MIDIHTHILPGFDDGAQTLEDAVAMARMAVGDGVLEVVATPHSAEWAPDHGREVLAERMAFLQQALDERSIRLRVRPGLEVHITPQLVAALEQKRIFTINDTQYLLLELPLSAYPVYTERVVFDLQIAGYVPIIAHPERNVAMQSDPGLLFTLVNRGAIAQVTAASLAGVFGHRAQESAQLMLRHRLVHIIASDAHSTRRRSPVLSAGVRVAAEFVGQEEAVAMVTTAPGSVLANQPLVVSEPIPLKGKSSRFKFW